MRLTIYAFTAAWLVAALLPSSALAQGARASSPPEFARKIDELKPGEWVWSPQVAPDGPVLVYVDLSRQIAMVYRNGLRIAATTVSTGKDGYETPTGVFTILQKDANHHSSLYNNAPMPFQERLTWDGVALHAGGLPGFPESHGCVHLPYEFSRELFAITSLGMTVVIEGDAIQTVETTANSLLAPYNARGEPTASPGLLDGEQFRWNPGLESEGPLSIIVSKLDQRIVVLRNGTEIGRSAALIDDPDPGSHVITLITRDGAPHWIYVAVTGHPEDEGREIDGSILDRVRLPRDFYNGLIGELRPGTTILVTNSRVEAEGAPQITVMDAISPTTDFPVH